MNTEIKKGKTKAYTTIITPKCELTGFCVIFAPSTKFNKKGVYTANVILDKEHEQKRYNTIKEVRTIQFKEFKKGKNDVVSDITAVKPLTKVNEETGEEIPDKDGRYILKANANAGIEEGKTGFKVAVFDAKGNPVSNCRLGAGSTVRLKLDLSGYSVAGKVGVSVKLTAVQIIDLVEYQVTAANAFEGFEVEEGYEFDETKAAENATDDDELGDNWEDEIGF